MKTLAKVKTTNLLRVILVITGTISSLEYQEQKGQVPKPPKEVGQRKFTEKVTLLVTEEEWQERIELAKILLGEGLEKTEKFLSRKEEQAEKLADEKLEAKKLKEDRRDAKRLEDERLKAEKLADQQRESNRPTGDVDNFPNSGPV